jgi:hypothetical protein
MPDEQKVEHKKTEHKYEKPERVITITDKGVDIKGEWTIGEILRVADLLKENVMRIKIGGA